MTNPNTSLDVDKTEQGVVGGLFPRFVTWLFGARVARLAEQTTRSHWLSYLLIIAQSITVVIVFGHAEVGLLFNANKFIATGAVLILFLLVATVVAADLALLETLTRIPALSRNRLYGAMLEHLWYVFFVMLTEAATYGVVLSTIESDPNALVSQRPLVATGGVLFWVLLLTRVTLLAWTTVQLYIVRGKLPVQLSTLSNQGKEVVGAHALRQMEALDISRVSLLDTFSIYAAMARPPRPIKTMWNGWLVKRALAQEAEEQRQTDNVKEALAALNRVMLPAPITPDDYPPTTPPDGPRDGGSDDFYRDATQGGRDHLSYTPPVPMVSGLTGYDTPSLPGGNHAGNHATSTNSDALAAAQAITGAWLAGKTPQAHGAARRRSMRSDGKRVGKSVGKSTGKRMLTYAQRNHQRVLEVRGWLAAGEQVSQQRIRKAFGVDNDAAKRILASAQLPALHVVGE